MVTNQFQSALEVIIHEDYSNTAVASKNDFLCDSRIPPLDTKQAIILPVNGRHKTLIQQQSADFVYSEFIELDQLSPI